MKAGIFLHESLSFATNPVSKFAIAAVHTLRLGLSCTLRVGVRSARAAGKGSRLKDMLLRKSLSKFKHERRLGGICP